MSDLYDLEDFEDDFKDEGIFSTNGRTVLIDGDILVYKPCCIFNEEDVRSQEMIVSLIKKKVNEICEAADASSYRIFLTTKKNFRDFIVDDYKFNRDGKERPVNLKWAKKFAMQELGGEVEVGLEADDLLSIHQTEDTVIWSPDKDLRNVPGKHLDDETLELFDVDELGELYTVPNKKPTKYYFSGFKGLMFQALTGDTADYIVGCGIRTTKVYKSGKKAGQEYTSREGIGPKDAFNLLNGINEKDTLINVVSNCYKNMFGDGWQVMMEKQVNLLFMVKDYNYKTKQVKRWTVDGREEFMNIKTGRISGEIL